MYSLKVRFSFQVVTSCFVVHVGTKLRSVMCPLVRTRNPFQPSSSSLYHLQFWRPPYRCQTKSATSLHHTGREVSALQFYKAQYPLFLHTTLHAKTKGVRISQTVLLYLYFRRCFQSSPHVPVSPYT